jgi:transposase
MKEVLRLWLRGTGTRKIAAMVDLDRKTVQRYIARGTEGSGLILSCVAGSVATCK